MFILFADQLATRFLRINLAFIERLPSRLSFVSIPARGAHTGGSPPDPPPIERLDAPSDHDAARKWIAHFRMRAVPRSAVKLAFSRSSGPGGQVSPLSCLPRVQYVD